MIFLAALAVFSGLSLNLLFSFALGAAGAAGKTIPKGAKQPVPLYQLGVMFLSVLFLWVFFSFAVPPFWMGFSMYFLFFPLSALVCMGFEFSCERLFPKSAEALSAQKIFSAFTAYDGLVPASLLLTFILAGTFFGALVLSLFFALGNLTAMLILNEIRRRSALERVPRFLKGSPLILISMGLLALISASVAVIGFRILEIFP
ncbi:MAG: hypothetical protein FWB99_04225 [Treponema sp.]|nr:hypothetical protein [Treponema sp.]MCL2232266.1 hypothetical protein [Treponema sp.]